MEEHLNIYNGIAMACGEQRSGHPQQTHLLLAPCPVLIIRGWVRNPASGFLASESQAGMPSGSPESAGAVWDQGAP